MFIPLLVSSKLLSIALLFVYCFSFYLCSWKYCVHDVSADKPPSQERLGI